MEPLLLVPFNRLENRGTERLGSSPDAMICSLSVGYDILDQILMSWPGCCTPLVIISARYSRVSLGREMNVSIGREPLDGLSCCQYRLRRDFLGLPKRYSMSFGSKPVLLYSLSV